MNFDTHRNKEVQHAQLDSQGSRAAGLTIPRRRTCAGSSMGERRPSTRSGVAGSTPALHCGPGQEKMILLSCSPLSGPRAEAGAFIHSTGWRIPAATPSARRPPLLLTDLARQRNSEKCRAARVANNRAVI